MTIRSVAILGAGAIGMLVGACLAQNGVSVSLLTRQKNAEAIRGNGVSIEEDDGTVWNAPVVCATDDISEVARRHHDAVLFAAKSYDTEDLARAWVAAGGQAHRAVSVQNTVGNEAVLSRYFEEVIGASVMLGGELVAPGYVRNIGPTRLLEFAPYGPVFPEWGVELVDALRRSGVDATVSADLQSLKFQKLVRNCDGALCAVTGIGVNHMTNSELGLSLRQRIRAEALAVADTSGLNVDPAVLTPLALTANSDEPIYCSMWVDVQRKRGKSEVPGINGQVQLLGRRFGVPTPVNAVLTRLIADMVEQGEQPGCYSLEEVEAFVQNEIRASQI